MIFILKMNLMGFERRFHELEAGIRTTKQSSNKVTLCSLRLGLHIVIFSASTRELFRSKSLLFFCTMYSVRFFPHVSDDNSEDEEKPILSRSIFQINFHSSMWNMDAALSDPICSTTQHLPT